tara:strand:+ start:195 stop:479 length:285 start_codon:yes stop_codon:yes gene_type:complete
MKDIFNLDSTGDLPKTLRQQLSLKLRTRSTIQDRVRRLFKDAGVDRTLCINEIMVGYYRKFKVEAKKQSVLAALSVLKKNGFIESKGHGQYRLC